jgi:Ser/Thr protein kinase RdoA (MazF antagonist)
MEEEAVETHIAAVVHMFGRGSLHSDPREIARGEIGRVFRVETSSGIWALKEYLTPTGAAGDLQLEGRFMHAAREAGVAVPRPCRTSEGRTVAVVGGVRWKAFEWIDVIGKPSAAQVGETVARLHGIGWHSNEAVLPWYTQRSAEGTWQELANLSHGQDWDALLGRHLAELIAQDQIVAGAEMPPSRICHRDINEGNAVLDAKDESSCSTGTTADRWRQSEKWPMCWSTRSFVRTRLRSWLAIATPAGPSSRPGWTFSPPRSPSITTTWPRSCIALWRAIDGLTRSCCLCWNHL